MQTNELDYDLPPDLIAQQPLIERSDSRLLVLDRSSEPLEHRRFCNLIDYLHPGDCLVLNDSKVIPARFYLRRSTGGRLEGLFLKLIEQQTWQVLLKNASRLKVGETICLADPQQQYRPLSHLSFTVTENPGQGIWHLQPQFEDNFLTVLDSYGITPLPPYIHRSPDHTRETQDRPRYQTVYARTVGSIAAPTAGLHFSNELLNNLQNKNIQLARVTLHVGLGTFKPITTENLEDHQMHSEYYQLDEPNAELINQTLQRGSRLVAVGTTAVRTLETIAQNKHIQPSSGWTNLFITPGYKFQFVGGLVTNFHLPRTSLLALVCAFATREKIIAAYQEAIRLQYRFYSYGDAMFIL